MASPRWTGSPTLLRTFNEHFGDIKWEDADRVRQLIIETIPERVREDTAFRNAQRNSDPQNARIEHDKALLRVMTAVMRDDTELFQAVHGQRRLQAMDDGHGVLARLRAGSHAVTKPRLESSFASVG